jgi:hypothetical protein
VIIECPECGTKNVTDKPPQPDKKYYCGKCGALITFLQTVEIPAKQNSVTTITDTHEGKGGFPRTALKMLVPDSENTSGQGSLATVLKEVQGWNWGAFWFSWIWSICNNVWIGLLALIPFLDIVMVFILGAKGNEWAWQNKRWDSVERFKRVQKEWSYWAWALLFVSIIILWIFYLASAPKRL